MATKKSRPTAPPPAPVNFLEIVENITKGGEPKAPSTSASTPEDFLDNLDKYTGIREQGVAVWLPLEVKKRLELARAKASGNIPLRSLAAAIVMTYIDEIEKIIENRQ